MYTFILDALNTDRYPYTSAKRGQDEVERKKEIRIKLTELITN